MATAATVFRDYETDGVPASGRHKPKKNEIRTWGSGLESIINAFLSNGGLIFASLSSLNADLAHAANSMAWVLGDATVANNGIYRKIGASGTGSWTRVSDLPFSFIIASDVGAGTANDIQATTSMPVSGSALVWMNVFRANTVGLVTVSFNGAAPLTIKTNSGSNVAAGGLVAGMIVLGIVSGSTFRLVSDQASAAIVAQAEAWANAASAYAAQASAAVVGRVGEGLNAVNSWRGYTELNTFTASAGAVKSNVDGYLKLVSSGATTQITLTGLAINGLTERYLAVRYRRNIGTSGWDPDEDAMGWQTSGHGFTSSFVAKMFSTPNGTWQTIILDMWNPSLGATDWKDNTVTGIRFFGASGVGSDVDIAWIATYSDAPRRGDVQNDLRYQRISSFNEIKLKSRGVTAGNTAAQNSAILDSVMAELAASAFPVGVVEFPGDWISFTGDRIYGSSTYDKSISFISPAGGRQIFTSGAVALKITNRFGELVVEDMHFIAENATSMTQILEVTNTGAQKGLKVNRNKFLRSGTTNPLIGMLCPRSIAGQFCDNDFQTGQALSFSSGGVGMKFTGLAGTSLEMRVAGNQVRSTGLAFDVLCGGTKAAPGIEGMTFWDNNVVGCRYGYQIVGIDDAANGYLAPLFRIVGGHVNVYETVVSAKNVSDVIMRDVNMYIDQFSGAPYAAGYFVYLEKVWGGGISENTAKMADSIPTGGTIKDIVAGYYLAPGTKDMKINDNQTMITTATPHVWIRTGAFANEVYDNKKVALAGSVGSNVVEESAATNTLRDNTGRVYS